MFWGLIMEPNKRYTQVVEKPFHISQAAMDISTGDNDACQVMVVVEGKNFLVCTLQKNKTIQVPLDLYFKSGDSVSFLTNGKCNVHLTGYLDPEFEEEPSDDEDEEEDEEEAPTLVPSKSKRKHENSNDVSASKKAKKEKKPAAADSSDDDDDEDQLQKLLDGEDIDTDDNDDSFKINTSAEADSDEDSDDDEDEDDEEDGEEAEDEEEEKDSDEEAETTLETSKEETIDMSKLSKTQKRRLKKKLKQQQEQAGKPPLVNGVDKAKKQQDGQKDKKKQDGKKEDGSGDKKEKKVVSGGVQIEDLKVGSGPVAKPGKTIAVYYEGRLKQNNKMFDSCTKGAGFKFRLGAKEVISGWDVGISGMKVGGKRRIVCPPAMAYGAKGTPPVIPPNSTLVFEVELNNVK